MSELIVKRKKYLTENNIRDGLLCDLVVRGLWRMAFQAADDAIERREKEIAALKTLKMELAE